MILSYPTIILNHQHDSNSKSKLYIIQKINRNLIKQTNLIKKVYISQFLNKNRFRFIDFFFAVLTQFDLAKSVSQFF